jgi:hypothetical protein
MDATSYEEFRENAEKGKKKKFQRYSKNLRYDDEGIYSYNTKIANLDFRSKTVQKIGYWSPTSSRHYNYAMSILGSAYDFTEVEAMPLVHVQHLSYDDHT